MATSSPLVTHLGAIYGNDGIFQPPKSSPSAKLSASVATGEYFSSGARKRQRSDASQVQESGYTRASPWVATPNYGQYSVSSEYFSAAAFAQPAFVNEQYSLAGGYDTPSLQAATLFEGLSVNNDNMFLRSQMNDGGCSNSVQASNPLLSGPLARERNGVARVNPDPTGAAQPSWTSFAFTLVGKMFTFGGSMIRGFYAGGGKGYDLHGNRTTTPPHSGYNDDDECSTPVPGAWDFGETMGTSDKIDPTLTTPSMARPPNKRRQTDRDTWVMIGTPDPDSSVLSPSRRPNLTRSNNAGRTGASRASSRRSAAPVLSRAPSYFPPMASPAQTAAPVAVSHERRASIASVRSPHGRPSNTNASTASVISPEAERFVRRQVRQERAADKAMNSMSRRLEDLIRQGQEALGTKYSVEGDGGMMEDEGFVDEIY